MHCPACDDATLAPSELEHGLLSLGCKDCDGHLVSLVSYRLWHDRFRAEATTDDNSQESLESDTRKALLCPKCQRVMLKHKYSATHSRRLDLCTHCDEVWFDGGEWEHLRRLALTDSLPAVFTEPWQRALRSQESEQSMAQRWRDVLGDDHDRAADIARWLADNPNAAHILRFLHDQHGGH
ncbi:MAG: zf-TFIIB domain-containing protein [Gammaproteobacteria bacterium]